MIPREFYCTKMQNYFQTFVFAFNTELPSFFFKKGGIISSLKAPFIKGFAQKKCNNKSRVRVRTFSV